MPSPVHTYNEHGVFLPAQRVWSRYGVTLVSLHRGKREFERHTRNTFAVGST